MIVYVALAHPRFIKAQRDIFVRPMAPDCMAHQCRMRPSDTLRLDACCQYGADVDVAERDGILRHRAGILAIMRPDAAHAPWFDGEEYVDPDFPSGRHVRTAVHDGGCVFLAHDRRGCAIHRAALEQGWDVHGVKPHVCRLFPLSYATDAIVLSDDYPDYSCSNEPGAPSVYRVCRDVVGAVFGSELVAALDQAEAQVLGAERTLRVIA